ncbi:MAG TPA: pantoate--beta-alanine ligase [Candidatus Limnocylindria bacterium]
MKVARTAAELDAALDPLRAAGPVGLVPTMGAFHDGHRSLFAAARAECATLVVSLFVNPAQFGAGEDFAAYPRDEAADAAGAEAAGVDVLFIPPAEVVYPPGFDTWVEPGTLGSVLEGAVRPGHFRGVATVCLKLFHLARPDRVYFGRKDAQQVAVIKAMLGDLDLASTIALRALPTVRDPDGLALSSRNVYLSAEERRHALALPRALEAGLAAHRSGADPAAAARAVLAAEPGLSVDYAAVADLDGPTLAAAVRIGHTRLIDNVRLEEEDAAGGG